MKKLALFDFCETLVTFQTAGPFIDFVREQMHTERMQQLEKIRKLLFKIKVTAVFNKLFPFYNFDKRLHLFQLRGFKKAILEKLAAEYYRDFILPKLIPDLLAEIKRKEAEGYTISIISGGYSIYLDYFAKDHKINDVIASEIGFNSKGICTGKIKGKDCMYNYKIKKLENHFSKSNLKEVLSIAYSDSITDLPLLIWADEGVVVSKEHSQSWAKLNGLKEIVWTSSKNRVIQ